MQMTRFLFEMVLKVTTTISISLEETNVYTTWFSRGARERNALQTMSGNIPTQLNRKLAVKRTIHVPRLHRLSSILQMRLIQWTMKVGVTCRTTGWLQPMSMTMPSWTVTVTLTNREHLARALGVESAPTSRGPLLGADLKIARRVELFSLKRWHLKSRRFLFSRSLEVGSSQEHRNKLQRKGSARQDRDLGRSRQLSRLRFSAACPITGWKQNSRRMTAVWSIVTTLTFQITACRSRQMERLLLRCHYQVSTWMPACSAASPSAKIKTWCSSLNQESGRIKTRRTLAPTWTTAWIMQ